MLLAPYQLIKLLLVVGLILTASDSALAQFQWEGTWKVNGEWSAYSDEMAEGKLSSDVTIRVVNDSVYVCFSKDVEEWLPLCSNANRVFRYPLTGPVVSERGTTSFDVSFSVYVQPMDDCASPFMLAGNLGSTYPQKESVTELSHQLTLRVNGKGILEGSLSSRWSCLAQEGVDCSFTSVGKQKGKK